MKVEELLKLKDRSVITIAQNETVQATLKIMVENNIGAMPVVEGGKIKGIVSERDLLKECALRGDAINKTKVKDIMSTDVVIGLPEDDLDYIESIMAQKHIRHLPIMADGQLGGIVSIRDIVEHQLKQAKAEARFLSSYISGTPQ